MNLVRVWVACVGMHLVVLGCVPPNEHVGDAELADVLCCSDEVCSPSPEACLRAACVDGKCIEVPVPAGDPCNAGLAGAGRCDDKGTCAPPPGAELCKQPSVPPVTCTTHADCDDENECTTHLCLAGFCHLFPRQDGTPCQDCGRTCTWGYCCPPPEGACAELHEVLASCVTNAECDDKSPCTVNTCDNGTCQATNYPDGTVCAQGTTYGLCLDGLCCDPHP